MNNYGYISIRGTYFCTSQSVLRLMLFALFHRGTCPAFLNFTHLLRLVMYRCGLKRYPTAVELPAWGAWCLRVNNGYKVFDPYTAIVTKVYNKSADKPLIAEEIKQQSAIGEKEFAPRLLEANEDEAWYREEMMSGKTGYHFSPTNTGDFMSIYSSEIAPVLRDLILFHPSSRMTVGEYVEHMPARIQREIDRIAELNPSIGKSIQSFFDQVLSDVQQIADEQIMLVFAHGDFHLFNLFSTEDGVKLLDWEGIGRQSLLFDCYTYFFSHLWTGKPEDCLVQSVDDGIEALAGCLQQEDDLLAMEIRERAASYLKLYYLERLFGYATTFQQTPEQFERWVQIYVAFEANAANRRRADERRGAVA